MKDRRRRTFKATRGASSSVDRHGYIVTMANQIAVSGACLLLTGCSAITATSDALDTLGRPPAEARKMESASLDEVVQSSAEGWPDYELGRRFEYGVDVPQDTNCAVAFYDAAAWGWYNIVQTPSTYSGGLVLTLPPTTYRRAGMPWAREALRRLRAPSAGRSLAPERERCRVLYLSEHGTSPEHVK